MTRINKLVMRGFKSFAKHTELVFGTKYNCVVGPNGSGKSNILDALCFVLGKTSAKSMRAEKSSNLIYNGGKAKTPAKEAEVAIYFDNGSKRFPTDDPEVKISRIVRHNGQSIYRINDKARNRQEIIDLLSLAKIEPDGYNIILQGDITHFVEMPPMERRLLIEEIAGISIYEDKKQKAMSQLEKVEERLKEAEIILAERNTYLKELKKDRDEAAKFKDLADKVMQNKATLLHLQIKKVEKGKSSLQESLEKAKKELQKKNDEVKNIRGLIAKGKEDIAFISKEIEEKGEVEQVSLNREIESLKISLAKNTTRLETLQSEIARISKRRQDLVESQRELDEKIKTLRIEITDQQKKKKALDDERQVWASKVAVFKDKNKMDGLADIEKKIEDLDRSAEELQKEVHALKESQHNLIRQKDLADHQLRTVDEQIKKVEELAKEHKKEIDDIKSKKETFKQSTLSLNKYLNEDSSLAIQIDKVREKIQKQREELGKLQARQASMQEHAKAEGALQKVLEQREKKPGIFGTIAELGKVDAKYALAMEIAAGPRLKTIVVEDEKVAADMIKFLKAGRYGHATFLPLSKIREPDNSGEAKKLAKSKGVIGLALELIDFDPRFKKAFEYVYANTVVIEDIDVARRLGIGKAKMVTLDGDIVETSGLMTGGYRKARPTMGFSQKELDTSMESIAEEMEELEQTLSTLENRRKEVEENITKLRQEKAEIEGEIIKSEKSLHLGPTDLELSLSKKEELQDELKKLDKEIEKITNTVSEKNRLLAQNRIEKQSLRAKTAQLRDPRLLAELATFEEKRNQLLQDIATAENEVKNKELQLHDIHIPENEKIGKILKQLSKEEDDFKTEMEYLEKEKKEKEGQLKKSEAAAKDFQARWRALFEKRNKLGDEINALELQSAKKLDESRKFEIQENTLTLQHAEIAGELAGLQQEFSQYEGIQLFESKTEEQLKGDIAKFEKLKADIGSVNMRALEVYDQVEKEYNSLLGKKETLSREKEDVIGLMHEIEGKKKELFMNQFNIVNSHFRHIFTSLSTKGEARLELENPQSPFEGGVDVQVNIAGSKFLDIRSLSGGEKTLTALAFIFAIQEHDPASFYIMDEVDAALDKRNAEKLARLVQKYSDKAQYIIISHNDGIVGQADILYGVSMDQDGMSKVVSLKV